MAKCIKRNATNQADLFVKNITKTLANSAFLCTFEAWKGNKN